MFEKAEIFSFLAVRITQLLAHCSPVNKCPSRSLGSLYSYSYGTEGTFLIRAGSVPYIIMAYFLSYGKLWFTPGKNLPQSFEKPLKAWTRKGAFISLVRYSCSCWSYAHIPSIAIFNHETLTSLPQDTGSSSQVLKGSPSEWKGSEGIQPQWWGWIWPLLLLQAFSSYCFLGITIRSEDLPCLCVASWPTESWSVFFPPPCAWNSDTVFTAAERILLGWREELDLHLLHHSCRLWWLHMVQEDNTDPVLFFSF